MTVLIAFFLFSGTAFVLLSAIGLLRMSNFFTKLQATSKAVTLGNILILVGVALHFRTDEAVLKSVGIVLFLLLSTPVATHALAKSYMGRWRYKSGKAN